ncbi:MULTISPECIES: FAD-dependent oxidoreductase [Rhodomicrobium]|uniref:FAD-dependent oxidoreductase n=1 Tax=Rhodomicrobium TaxID=1068 RepID=UPI000BA7C8B2|nr:MULTISPECIES: FAD-dependent oxidoreductase [Rhodomicrobium]
MSVIDAHSIAGKLAAPEATVDVLVVGAGAAGVAAATELAEAGLSVMLVDENPVDAALIGMDVPHYFGGRAGAAVQNKGRMLEQVVASEPALEGALAAGVEILLGTSCWGVFLPGPATRELPGAVAGLTDDARAWTVGFRRIVVAIGARDLVVYFDGADQPGVMGAAAFHALAARYDAFDGRRLVIFGSDELALATAELAFARGLEIAALIEVDATPRGPAQRVSALAERGVPVLCGQVIKSAGRGPTGVTGVEIASLDGGPARTIACDTVCLAIGLVPVIELFDTAGVPLALDTDRGGFVAGSTDGVSTGSPLVFGAGDCMAVSAALATRSETEAHGRRAARAVLASLGRADPLDTSPPPRNADQLAYQRRVMEALLSTGGLNVLACQCEDVTRADLLGVRAPRYLASPSDRSVHRDLATLAADGPLNHDQMKRLTRVSMGPCQARRCREQVAMLMAMGGGVPPESIPVAGYRAPVRPLPLAVLATLEETDAMAANWPIWFSIASQWIPYDLIGTDAEATFIDDHTHL